MTWSTERVRCCVSRHNEHWHFVYNPDKRCLFLFTDNKQMSWKWGEIGTQILIESCRTFRYTMIKLPLHKIRKTKFRSILKFQYSWEKKTKLSFFNYWSWKMSQSALRNRSQRLFVSWQPLKKKKKKVMLADNNICLHAWGNTRKPETRASPDQRTYNKTPWARISVQAKNMAAATSRSSYIHTCKSTWGFTGCQISSPNYIETQLLSANQIVGSV